MFQWHADGLYSAHITHLPAIGQFPAPLAYFDFNAMQIRSATIQATVEPRLEFRWRWMAISRLRHAHAGNFRRTDRAQALKSAPGHRRRGDPPGAEPGATRVPPDALFPGVFTP